MGTRSDREMSAIFDPAGVTPESLERLGGMEVRDVAGEKVGTVGDVYVDVADGTVRYVGVATGWFGTRRHLVPIDEVRLEAGDYLVVPYDRETLREGPAYEGDEVVTREHEGRVYGHYGRAAYWDPVQARQTAPAPTPEIAEAEVQAAVERGDDPGTVAVKRWGV